ncbi:hypothetical protein HPP92_002563 [Vanilla planifolia]|uniref:Uncharacterized protein n=1 Tax=Vanilla planifolia TaxID=51239 RepID=A0A835S212_VANPL|nr:hypothetical protein HPP92_002563 [Vanilla planifolia]
MLRKEKLYECGKRLNEGKVRRFPPSPIPVDSYWVVFPGQLARFFSRTWTRKQISAQFDLVEEESLVVSSVISLLPVDFPGPFTPHNLGSCLPLSLHLHPSVSPFPIFLFHLKLPMNAAATGTRKQ